LKLNPPLEAFLFSKDLDQLLEARQAITVLDQDDEAVVRAVLKEWSNPQSVANLLFHPSLIPADMRVPTLMRGLAERGVMYYVLAAIVGFGGMVPELTAGQREEVAALLLEFLPNSTGVLAQRASVTLSGVAREADAPAIFSLLEHEDDTARHNLRAWLFRTFEKPGIEAFTVAAARSTLDAEAQAGLVREFAEIKPGAPPEVKRKLLTLFSYIPNLDEVKV